MAELSKDPEWFRVRKRRKSVLGLIRLSHLQARWLRRKWSTDERELGTDGPAIAAGSILGLLVMEINRVRNKPVDSLERKNLLRTYGKGGITIGK